MTTFVLVPGGWHGGYSWQPTADLLVAQGHEVRALTLEGLGSDRPRRDPEPNLDDHIAQVVAEIDRADPPVALCGHSYGGMVISGAADGHHTASPGSSTSTPTFPMTATAAGR